MRLFKYLHPDRTDVLRNHAIRFSSPKVLNDPFEMRPHIAGYYPPGRLSSEFARLVPEVTAQEYSESPAQLRAVLPLEVFQAFMQPLLPRLEATLQSGFEMIVPPIRQMMTQKFEENLGILCLTESPTNLLMWAHYADSHQGLVSEFDPESPFFDQRVGPEDDLRHLRKVIYQDERPAVFLTEIEDFSPFLTKGIDWSYEAEWRMMMPLFAANQIIGEGPTAVHLFEVPKAAIKGVIFGCRMSDEKKTEIRQILQDSPEYEHVRCSQARIDEEHYRVLVTDGAEEQIG